MKNNPIIEIKPYNNKELAALYKVGRKTMARWLKLHHDAIGKKEGKLYTSLQVKTIFELLGPPPGMDE